MNIAGYLVTLANLQTFAASGGGQAKDISLRVGPLQDLFNEITNLPNFPIESFRNNGYSSSNTVGKYISQNLQDYIFKGRGNPDDEGLILTLYFADSPELPNINGQANNIDALLHDNEQHHSVRAAAHQSPNQQPGTV